MASSGHQTKKLFSWIRNTRLNSFMDAYHAPYVTKNCYWTGLLLLILCIILYLISAMNIYHNPRDNLLSVSVIASIMPFLVKILVHNKLYKKWSIDLLETSSLFNLLSFSIACFHTLGDRPHQRVVAFVSTSI